MPRSAASASTWRKRRSNFAVARRNAVSGSMSSLPRQVGHGEQQVAELFLQGRLRCVIVHLVFEFGDLFLDLVDDRIGIRPVEADPRRAL